MAITVLTNSTSLEAQQNLNNTQMSLSTVLQQLSSGLRINSAADDAAGLAISNRMASDVAGLNQAQQNAQDGTSLLQTGDSAMAQVGNLLTNMNSLAVESANGTLGASDRTALQQQFAADGAEIDQISAVTNFNGVNLLDGSLNVNLQIGTGTTTASQLNITQATAISQSGLALSTSTIATVAGAQAAITSLTAAINTVSTARGTFGAVENQLNSVEQNLSSSDTNEQAAEGRITNVDFAQATAKLSADQVLQQAGAAALTQANQIPQIALKLLGQ